MFCMLTCSPGLYTGPVKKQLSCNEAFAANT